MWIERCIKIKYTYFNFIKGEIQPFLLNYVIYTLEELNKLVVYNKKQSHNRVYIAKYICNVNNQ